jgi:threonine/homoserine/homoserine lactone efflux protein
MFGTHDLWLFAATVFVLNATPGVDLMLTLTRTLQHGVRAGLATALGVSAGCVLHALAAAFGLAALLATSALAFGAVKWAGAAYLLWLAFAMLRNAGRRTTAPPDVSAPVSTESQPPSEFRSQPSAAPSSGAASTPVAARPCLARLFRQGLLTNALNPKVALFFLALLPQFIDGAAEHKTLVFLFLGAWFVVQGTFFLAGFVLLVAPLARWRPSAALERVLQGLGGLLFIGLAARLAFTERP